MHWYGIPTQTAGGATITSYVVEMDDGTGGAWEEVAWGESTLERRLEVIDLLPGRTYLFDHCCSPANSLLCCAYGSIIL